MRVAHAARNLRLAPSLVFAAASMLGWLPRVVRETICRTFSVEVFSWLIYVFFFSFFLWPCVYVGRTPAGGFGGMAERKIYSGSPNRL